MKTPSKIFTWSFHLKSTFSDLFSKKLIFWKYYFLENIFLHDEIIFCVRIFFCDQVCIYTNPRNHLEHLPCPHDDSEPPTKKNQTNYSTFQTEIQWFYEPDTKVMPPKFQPSPHLRANWSPRPRTRFPSGFFLWSSLCIIILYRKNTSGCLRDI